MTDEIVETQPVQIEYVVYNDKTSTLDIRLMNFDDAITLIKKSKLERFWNFYFDKLDLSDKDKVRKHQRKIKSTCLYGLYNYEPGSFVRLNRLEVMFLRSLN